MSFTYNANRLSLPTEITRTVSNASFYASLSIHQRFDRLGSGQDLDLFGTSVARSSVRCQMSLYFINLCVYLIYIYSIFLSIEFIRKVYLITLFQFLIITMMTRTFLHFTYWHEERYKMCNFGQMNSKFLITYI